MKVSKLISLVVMALLFCRGSGAKADEVRIAVASNFGNVMKNLVALFEVQAPHRVILIYGSTGKHYAQIRNGAPFDAFFAADSRRPEMLEKEGIALAGSRFTYALGRIVLWSPQAGLVDNQGRVLRERKFHYLAIANPGLAPYGQAAWEVLQKLGLWDRLQPFVVRGENIGQTFQFVQSGNADLGFVALAQVWQPDQSFIGSWWEVPSDFYSPITQQAVLLKDKIAARLFLDFVRSDKSLRVIREFGYGVP